MRYSRRQLLTRGIGGLASLGAASLLPGCQNGSTTQLGMPLTPWPDLRPHPDSRGNGYTPSPVRTVSTATATKIPGVNPRSAWTSTGPMRSRINPMRGVSRITIHHEGMPTAFTATGRDATRTRLELIRNSHVNHRKWADIGYHFIVDRAGRVWTGRSLAYQGAHVKNENENNIGVMCLGNFEIQTPSAAQVTALENFVRDLRRRYRVTEARIYTHRELGLTTCPGRNLQPRIDWMRKYKKFA